jgi:ribA/ribD-fused uncharacterized protein
MIDSFREEYAFLSNFYPVVVTLDEMNYPTVEHAFQAAKCLDLSERIKICKAKTPGQAKRLGRQVVSFKKNWNDIRVKVMRDLLYQKFGHKQLLFKLLATGNQQLVEGNTWHDNFWGVCQCGRCTVGQNQLGKLLMEIRQEVRDRLLA